MQRVSIIAAQCVAMLLAFAAAAVSEDAKPFGLTAREPWTTSKVIGTPEPPPPYVAERIYPQIQFKNPVFLAQEPGTDRIVVAELGGMIYAFSKTHPTPESKQAFLETKRQFASFSFHPKYAENGQIFVFSEDAPSDKSTDKRMRVSRFRTNLEHPRKVLPDSEEIIIEWPAGGHSGGEAIIGPDGYLYISTGDSTSGSDPKETGQGVDDLFSVMMRLDVDHPDPGKAYSIPKDNPFIHMAGARPEIWAHGFRNPWRFCFDDAGRLWCGDVGQDLWEMIWLVEKGGNYGWSVQEGSHPFHPHKKVGPGPISPPIVEHHHSECRSITGGYMYRGPKHPELDGIYFYGDYEYGMIWGFRYDGAKAVEHRVLADTPLRIPTFAVTRDGEIIFCDHTTGELHELVKSTVAPSNADFPKQLSETGLFTSVAEHQLAPGMLMYSVNAPQWLDNGLAERFVGLPSDSKITFVETSGNASTWGFENGTVAAQTISLEMEEGNPASRKRIETRIVVKQQNHWLGYSYLWNDDQTDAVLVGSRGRDLALAIKSPAAPNGLREQTWHIPSRNECMVCHSRAAAFVLGLRTEQMNRDHDYTGIVDNQLRAFDHAGIFTEKLKKSPPEYAALKNPYADAADLNGRARAYLHVNCAVCHVVDGGGNARMVLLHETRQDEMKVVGEKPIHGDFGVTDARLIAPGDPFASVLFYRMSKVGRGRMPHVSSNVTDARGLEMMKDWILTLPPGPVSAVDDLGAQSSSDITSALNTLQAQTDSAIEQLLQSTRGALMLAAVVAQESTPAAVRSAAIARGVAHPDANVRDLFERFIPESQRTKLLGDIFDTEPLLTLTGDAERGRNLFLNAAGLQCRNCHKVGDSGLSFGADLNQIGKKYQRPELLEALVDPSRKIDPKYATYVLVRHDGTVATGLLVEKTDREVVLNTLKDGKPHHLRILAEDVEELVPQTKSLMPDRQLRDLTAQQAADLLEFLTTLK